MDALTQRDTMLTGASLAVSLSSLFYLIHRIKTLEEALEVVSGHLSAEIKNSEARSNKDVIPRIIEAIKTLGAGSKKTDILLEEITASVVDNTLAIRELQDLAEKDNKTINRRVEDPYRGTRRGRRHRGRGMSVRFSDGEEDILSGESLDKEMEEVRRRASDKKDYSKEF